MIAPGDLYEPVESRLFYLPGGVDLTDFLVDLYFCGIIRRLHSVLHVTKISSNILIKGLFRRGV